MTLGPGVARLLRHGPGDGAWNMAVDEALVESQRQHPGKGPTLRLYGWYPPALSLGRSQPAEGAHDADYLRREGIALVRRPTGGRAVLHENEITYCLAARLDRPPFDEGVVATYRRIAHVLQRALRGIGVAAELGPARPTSTPRDARAEVDCFASLSAHEIVVGRSKIVGSAQLRRGAAFLQHGSLKLRPDPHRLAGALGRPLVAGGPSAEIVPAVREVLEAAIAEALATELGLDVLHGGLEPEEQLMATRLRAWKYLTAEWTLAGRFDPRAPWNGAG